MQQYFKALVCRHKSDLHDGFSNSNDQSLCFLKDKIIDKVMEKSTIDE